MTENHLVAYIDLLGFTDAVDSSLAQEKNELLQLLQTFASVRKEAPVHDVQIDTPSYKYIVARPGFMSVSDSIIISYKIPTSRDINMALIQLTNHISWVAAHALKKGFLIRGGISIGEMYYKDDIFMGKAYIDAYRLESQLAIFPRVLIHESLKDNTEHYFTKPDSQPFYRFIEDIDGMYMLDYFSVMIFITPEFETPAYLNEKEAIINQIKLFNSKINKNITNLKYMDKARTKWKWFLHHFNLTKERLHDPNNDILKDIHKI
jgi:hypothetical protein